MTNPPVPESVFILLRRAHQGIAEAVQESAPGARYVAAHLAALRAAAAVIAARGEPSTGRRSRRPRSVWEVMPSVEPAFAEWAAYFADGAEKRARAEAGFPTAVTVDEAERHLGQAEAFLALVESTLGVQVQPPLPLRVVGA